MALNGVFSATPLDSVEVAKADLDIRSKTRSNPLPWNGQFSPQLVEVLLREYAEAGQVVLDPFVGSGTTLLECFALGLPAIGGEINPAAVLLSRLYEVAALGGPERDTAILDLEGRLDGLLPTTLGPLFSGTETAASAASEASLEKRLVEVWKTAPTWAEEVLSAALVVLSDFHKPGLDSDRIYGAWNRIKGVIRGLPSEAGSIKVLHADARDLPLGDDSVGLVLTSPPYINVFNYHQNYRRSVEALEWDVLGVARSEIGSNRKHRGNRFLTVIQYCLDMAQVLKEAARVTVSGGRLIFVVGRESTVRGTAFLNGELVAEVASKALGLNLLTRQERRFQNRFGQDIFEDILHFPSADDLPPEQQVLSASREVARLALRVAADYVPEKENGGLHEAVDRLDEVHPSPILEPPSLACVLPEGNNDGATHPSR